MLLWLSWLGFSESHGSAYLAVMAWPGFSHQQAFKLTLYSTSTQVE
jgi:hypothetical protein